MTSRAHQDSSGWVCVGSPATLAISTPSRLSSWPSAPYAQHEHLRLAPQRWSRLALAQPACCASTPYRQPVLSSLITLIVKSRHLHLSPAYGHTPTHTQSFLYSTGVSRRELCKFCMILYLLIQYRKTADTVVYRWTASSIVVYN